jgi:hypothetical protein
MIYNIASKLNQEDIVHYIVKNHLPIPHTPFDIAKMKIKMAKEQILKEG